MFDMSFSEIAVIGVVALVVLGPERLPYYASQLARLVKSLRSMANGAKERMREEMGPDFDDIDWKKLDPRQYDPRRIIREALSEDDEPVLVKPVESAYAQRQRLLSEARPAPFDAEAT